MAQNLGSKKEFLRQVDEHNKEAKQPKKGFATQKTPVIPMVPGKAKKGK